MLAINFENKEQLVLYTQNILTKFSEIYVAFTLDQRFYKKEGRNKIRWMYGLIRKSSFDETVCLTLHDEC